MPTREARREANRRYRERHPERVKAQRDRYRSTEKYKSREQENRKLRREDGRSRSHQLKYLYGIDSSTYDAMIQSQRGLCAVCDNPPTGYKMQLVVDHNHGTGVVRGLLCDACNIALGKLRDNPVYARRAAEYLERFA